MALDVLDLLSQIQADFSAGRLEEARAALEGLDTRREEDAPLHLGVARLAEELGEVDRAASEYNRALERDPQLAEALRRLARLRVDQGLEDKALRCFKKLLEIDPADLEAAEELARLVAQNADPGASSPATTGPFLEHPPVTDSDTVTLASRFAGRQGVYARQWASGEDRQGYTPVREPFTPAIARAHLLGDMTVGIYPVRLDDTVWFVAFDFDISKSALEGAHTTTWNRLQRTVHGAAAKLAHLCGEVNLPAYLEDSGQKGRHLWVFFAEPLKAAIARRLAGLLLGRLGPLPHDVQVEVFPKQDHVPPGGLGNLIKIPLGIHRKTGRRAHFVDIDGHPIADQLALLRDLQPATVEQVLEAINGVSGSSTPWDDPEPDSADQPRPRNEPLGIAADRPAGLATAVPYDRSQDEELCWLLSRCSVLSALVGKAESAHELDGEERKVLTYTLGHLTRGADAVNSVLRELAVVEPAEFLKSPLRGHPMSCPKIKSRAARIACEAGCDCSFDTSASYPHPLLHLQELRCAGPLDDQASTLTARQVERAVGELLKIKTQTNQLAQIQAGLETRLRAYLTANGLTSASTTAGTAAFEAERGLVIPTSVGSGT